MGVGFKMVDNDGGLFGNWTEALGLFERVWPKGRLTGLLRSERLTMSVALGLEAWVRLNMSKFVCVDPRDRERGRRTRSPGKNN
uniref:Uncharacterized protein n=1 Tax=Fagus sylvatica TaxID=28930 RepID=A0A2N9F4J3_FAGSY